LTVGGTFDGLPGESKEGGDDNVEHAPSIEDAAIANIEADPILVLFMTFSLWLKYPQILQEMGGWGAVELTVTHD
jgi:hypothetical protein